MNCPKQELAQIKTTQDIRTLADFMSYCENECLDQSRCQSYADLEQRWKLLKGEAKLCKCCEEVTDISDLNERGYCDRCQRAEESRC